jgi:hypothetical protein
VRTFADPSADVVPAVQRVSGVAARILDRSRAVPLGEVKLTLDHREWELWIARVSGLGLEGRATSVEVSGDIERAVREAKARLDGRG